MRIRPERSGDDEAIRALTRRAFDGAPHSSGTEAGIVDGLREAEALTISLVTEDVGAIVGHVAFSPVEWAGGQAWFGLGPVSVEPSRQSRGIGSTLIRAGLERLEQTGAGGCVVLGDPAYYCRFGFVVDPRCTYEGAPTEYFMALAFRPIDGRGGAVHYHPAFG